MHTLSQYCILLCTPCLSTAHPLAPKQIAYYTRRKRGYHTLRQYRTLHRKRGCRTRLVVLRAAYSISVPHRSTRSTESSIQYVSPAHHILTRSTDSSTREVSIALRRERGSSIQYLSTTQHRSTRSSV
eukprot:571565-Rhodomonas_salina.1